MRFLKMDILWITWFSFNIEVNNSEADRQVVDLKFLLQFIKYEKASINIDISIEDIFFTSKKCILYKFINWLYHPYGYSLHTLIIETLAFSSHFSPLTFVQLLSLYLLSSFDHVFQIRLTSRMIISYILVLLLFPYYWFKFGEFNYKIHFKNKGYRQFIESKAVW